MAVTAYKFPGTVTDQGSNWQNPNNVKVDDGSNASSNAGSAANGFISS